MQARILKLPSMKKTIHLCFLLLLASCQPSEPPRSTSPNVLFIAVDDLRPEFGAYGAAHMHSPNLDKLASESLIFDRAYCNIPVCGSSRASLLAGLRPGWHRFPGAYDTYLSKDAPDVVSLPRHFSRHGYRTLSYGKIYHHSNDDTLAWEEIWDPAPRNSTSWRDYQTKANIDLHENPVAGARASRGLPYERAVLHDTAYFDGRIAKKAVATLEELGQKKEPFFLAVGFLKPHLPFNAPERYWAMYDSMDIELPTSYQRPISIPDRAYHNFGELRNYATVPEQGAVSEQMAQQLIHGYYACVSYTDAQIGKVLDALQSNGLSDNTIVILWGDHGWNLGDHQLWCKHCNFETSLHTPLLLRVPGETDGQRTAAIVEYIDIYPTLTELAGLPDPEHLDGESLVRLLRNEPRQKDYAIVKYWQGMTLIKEDWFYTEWIDSTAEVTERMLYDHSVDGLELNNLAEEPVLQDTVRSLSSFLHAHWGQDFFSKVADL